MRSHGPAAIGLLAGVAALAGTAPAATFTVTKTPEIDDGVRDGDCSLREAIAAANRTSIGAEIRFDLPASYRIDLRSALPALCTQIALDGATQDDAECPLPIVHVVSSLIDSGGPVNGMEVFGDHDRVRGLVITNFSGHGGVLVYGRYHLFARARSRPPPTDRQSLGRARPNGEADR